MQALHFTVPQFFAAMAGYALVLMIIIGVTARGYRTTKMRYLLADRRVGALMGAISIACAWAWAPAFFVSSQITFLNGWVGLFWFIAMNAGSFVVFAFFADRFRKMVPKGYTLSGEMRVRYSPRVQALYLLAHAMLAISAFAVQLLAGGPIIERLTGLPFFWATVIFAVVPIVYTMYAGLYASVITDAVKGAIIVVIIAIVIPWAVHEAGGLSVVLKGIHGTKATPANGLVEEFFTGNGLAVMLAFGIPASLGWIAGQFGDPYYWQQAEALKENSVKWTFLLAAPIFALIPLSLSVLGFLAGGMGLSVENSQLVNIEVVGTLLPWWAGMLFIFLLISALISTLDSHLSAIASLAGHDLFNWRTGRSGNRELMTAYANARSVRYSWTSMLALTVVGIAIANGTLYLLEQQPGTTIVWLFLCYGTLRAATFLPTIITLLRRDVSEAGMFWGILVSLAGGLPLFVYGNLYNITWAKITGSLVAMLASGAIVFLTSKRSIACAAA